MYVLPYGFDKQIFGAIKQLPSPNSELWDGCATPFRAATPIRGRYETRWKPMQCECFVDRPNQGLVRCANEATQRLTISHLKIRLLACEACGARQIAWAGPWLPGLVVVEPLVQSAHVAREV